MRCGVVIDTSSFEMNSCQCKYPFSFFTEAYPSSAFERRLLNTVSQAIQNPVKIRNFKISCCLKPAICMGKKQNN